MNEQQLIQFFNKKNYAKRQLECFLLQNLDKKQFFEKEYLKYQDRFSFYVFVKYYYLGLLDLSCKKCGKLLTYKQIKDGFNYCSYKCCNNDYAKKQKTIETNMKKYGCSSPAKNKQILQKMKNTNLQRTGFCYPTLNKSTVKKSKKTCLQKYGVQNVSQNNQIKNKIRQNNLAKYGYCSLLANPQIRKLRIENQKKQFWVLFLQKIKPYVVPLFQFADYNGYGNGQIYRWRCVKCGKQFFSNIKTTDHIKSYRYIPRCLNCYPYISGFSNLQKQIFNFVISVYNNVVENDRSVIPPYQLDIYIPQKKLGIQFDGLIWHSNKFKKDDFNLLHKTQKCQQIGIKLIHVFQDEWIYNKNFVKKMIKLNFQNNINIFDYAEKFQNDKYTFDRRYFSKFDFENQQISYTEPQKFYIKNNQRINQTQQNLYYIFDCGNLILNDDILI